MMTMPNTYQARWVNRKKWITPEKLSIPFFASNERAFRLNFN